MAEVAALRAEVATLRALVVPKPRQPIPRDDDRAVLAWVARRVEDGAGFMVGDLTDDPGRATQIGKALGRLARFPVVDGYVVEKVREVSRRAVWRVRYVGGDGVLRGSDPVAGEDDPGA